jgi:hypothetical protein
MNLFYSRVPFIIEVAGDSSQIATKIELFIWNLGATEPTTPTHIIEKEIFTPTQYIGKYNISPFVADKTSNANKVLNVKVVKYYKLVTDWILDEELEYVSAYGYGNFISSLLPAVPLIENYDKRYYRDNRFLMDLESFFPTIDVIFDFDYSDTFRIVYTSSLGSETIDYSFFGIKLMTIFLTTENVFFDNGNQVQLQYFDGTDFITFKTYNIENVCEPKFIPYIISFINSFGGITKATFFKKSTTGNEVKGTDYNLQGLKQSFNINGVSNLKLNTGWVDENYKGLIKELLLSEHINIFTAEGYDLKQAVVKTSSFIEKTNLNDKVINYEIDFELSTPLIQNYV